MRKGMGILLVLFLASQSLLAQQPLAITRVLLYKNGMAYIVRFGQISAPVSLTFHPEDMNDVLKSFTAWNPNSGDLYSVGYTTGIPSGRTLSRYPFDISAAQTGLGAFLLQVKGAEIRRDHSGKDVQGKLVAAQEATHVALRLELSRRGFPMNASGITETEESRSQNDRQSDGIAVLRSSDRFQTTIYR